jgi:DNA polymerase-3 subunit gamma/tau
LAEEKQYQSLYRKYRPQTPDEVLGQEHVVRALVGAVREGRLAHAFLFCGPRGTGKTSTARILAKMVNCESGPTPEPCGKCEQCLRIADGSHLDVVEIDAASHGGVDDARELRERAPTAPALSREKVYIIDEAQRLSREAFDALLKVFEEPPPGVRFVLATTEPHKMPATIVGRCQRFEFRRATTDVIADHLVRVAGEEGIKLSAEAAEAVARQSEGSFRDALSVLDQASVLGGSEIGEEVLAQLLGAPRAEIQYATADAVAVGDTASVFEIVDRLVQEGQDVRHATSEALQHFRNLLIANTAPGQADLLDLPADEYERLRAQASKFQPAELSRVIGLLLAAQTDMRWTTSPRLTLELALVRATMPEADPAPEALVARIERIERLAGVEPGPSPAPVAEASKAGPARLEDTAVPQAEAEAEEEEREEAPAVGPAPTTDSVDVQMLRRSWPSLVERLRTARQMILAANLESVTPISFDGSILELSFPPGREYGVAKVQGREQDLRAALQDLFGISPEIRCVVREPVAGPPGSDIEEEPPMSAEEALTRLQSELDARIAPDKDA